MNTDRQGFNVGNPIKVTAECAFKGLRGFIEDRSANGTDYWCSIEGKEGCYRFTPQSLELNITINILEIVTLKDVDFPLDLAENLKNVRYIEAVSTGFYVISRYDLQRKMWKKLSDVLEAADGNEIIDYRVQYHG